MTSIHGTLISRVLGILSQNVKRCLQLVVNCGYTNHLDVKCSEQIFCIKYLREGLIFFSVGTISEQIENYLAHLGYSILYIILGNQKSLGGKNVSTVQFSMHIAEPI